MSTLKMIIIGIVSVYLLLWFACAVIYYLANRRHEKIMARKAQEKEVKLPATIKEEKAAVIEEELNGEMPSPLVIGQTHQTEAGQAIR